MRECNTAVQWMCRIVGAMSYHVVSCHVMSYHVTCTCTCRHTRRSTGTQTQTQAQTDTQGQGQGQGQGHMNIEMRKAKYVIFRAQLISLEIGIREL